MWEESALESISSFFRLYPNLKFSDPGNGMERELELELGPANPRITRQPQGLFSLPAVPSKLCGYSSRSQLKNARNRPTLFNLISLFSEDTRWNEAEPDALGARRGGSRC